MDIRILCVGTLKERFWVEAAAEYAKRLSKYCTLQIDEIKESDPVREGEILVKRIKKEDFVIALAIKGTPLRSEELAEKISSLALSGESNLVFVIGGSLGLAEKVLTRADFCLSFSRMTFPHQLMRVILLEQIYRSFKIIRGEKYHK